MYSEAAVSVKVTHRFDAAPERVFAAWLDANQVGRWLFATPKGEMVRVEIDPRVGGSFCLVDRREGEDVAHTGKYLEIDPPRRLVFTFCVPKYSSESTRVSIDIIPVDAGCMLTLIHEGVLESYDSRTRFGWSGILDRLAETLR